MEEINLVLEQLKALLLARIVELEYEHPGALQHAMDPTKIFITLKR